MPLAGKNDKPKDMRTISSFASRMKTMQQNNTVPSSVYSIPASQACDRLADFSVHVASQQGIAQPIYARKQDVMTRRGQIVGASDDHLLQGVVPVIESSQGVTLDDSEDVYVPPRAYWTREQPSPPSQANRGGQEEALARLEGSWPRTGQPRQEEKQSPQSAQKADNESFWEHVQFDGGPQHQLNEKTPVDALFEGTAYDTDVQRDAGEAVVMPRFSTTPNKPSRTSSGVFRRLSFRAKAAPTPSRESSKPPRHDIKRISEPHSFHDFDPRHSRNDVLHPEIKAIPIREAQQLQASLKSRPNISRPYEFRRRTNHLAWQRPSFVEDNAVPIQQRAAELADDGQVPHRLRRVKAKIVGHEDNSTLFGDFIDAANEDSESDDRDVLDGIFSNSEFDVLKMKPLPPLPRDGKDVSAIPPPLQVPRKPVPVREQSGTLENEAYLRPASAPAEPQSLPQRSPGRGQADWRFDVDYPTIEDLFDDIDQRIADSDMPHVNKPAANTKAHRVQQWINDVKEAGEFEPETEMIIDTFVNRSRCDWVATERRGSKVAFTEQRTFKNEIEDNVRDRADAACMMRRFKELSR